MNFWLKVRVYHPKKWINCTTVWEIEVPWSPSHPAIAARTVDATVLIIAYDITEDQLNKVFMFCNAYTMDIWEVDPFDIFNSGTGDADFVLDFNCLIAFGLIYFNLIKHFGIYRVTSH